MGVLLLPVAGCTNPHPPAEGSWIEILEIEESPDALDVENLASFRAVEVHEDRLIFTFDGASPLRVGHVVAASGPDREGYLRRVVAVNAMPDGRIEAMTEPADLHEYYPKLSFIFHYNPRRVDEPRYVEFGDVGAATEAETENSCGDTTPCNMGGDQALGNETAGCSGGAGISMSPFVETDFQAEFVFDPHVDIGFFSASIDPDAYAVLDGQVRTGIRFTGAAGAQLTCNADFAAMLGGGEAPQVTLAFLQIGPIPVTVTAKPVLEGEVQVAGDVGEYSVVAGVEATAHSEFGIKSSDPFHEEDFTFDSFADVSTSRAGSLSASGTISAGVEVELQVGYDFKVGPAEIDVGANATMALVGSLGIDMTADLQGCGWTVDIPWSCDVKFGAGVDLKGGVGPLDVDLSLGPFDIAEINLASGSLGTLSGGLPWCMMSPSMCVEGGATCHDDAYDNSVCEGMMGFQSCGGGEIQYCTCTAGGWADCGPCMLGT